MRGTRHAQSRGFSNVSKNAKNVNNALDMYCGLLVSNDYVSIGHSSPAAGARLKGGLLSNLQSVSRHAEMDALRWLRRHQARKAKLVVVRFTADGRFGDSRPCLHCIKRIMRHHPNVASVTFFESGTWLTEPPGLCAVASKLTSAERIRDANEPAASKNRQ